MKNDFRESVQSVGVLAPKDIVATATTSEFIECKNVAGGTVNFDVFFGAVGSTDVLGPCVTVVTAQDSVTDTSPVAVAFYYRLSEAVATDSVGAITLADSTGVVVYSSTDDNKILHIYVAPPADAEFIAAKITPTTDSTACNVCVIAKFQPRYAGNSLPSST